MQSIRNFNGMDGVIYCAIVKGCTPVQKRVPWMPKTNRSSLRDVLESIVQWRREAMKEGKIRNFLVDDDEKSINIFTYIRHCFISGISGVSIDEKCADVRNYWVHQLIAVYVSWLKLECYRFANLLIDLQCKKHPQRNRNKEKNMDLIFCTLCNQPQNANRWKTMK